MIFDFLFTPIVIIYCMGFFIGLYVSFFLFKKRNPGKEMKEDDLNDIIFTVSFWPFMLVLTVAIIIVHVIMEYIIPFMVKIANKILKYI